MLGRSSPLRKWATGPELGETRVTSSPRPAILLGLGAEGPEHEIKTMTKNSKQFMSAFALSAAALFLGGCKKTEATTDPGTAADATASPGDATADEQVKCFGINECAGQSVCAVSKPDLGIEHACAGENECSAKGWIQTTRGECDEKSGEVLGTL
ncbi:hypothetical protein [Enhygromyxa salina]|uniref:hypothetical protein n=1 Tax=Enhygromyxa salina TaxID=215803 RepID=UPI0015E611C6|nr:hypothetical protein [Enhygromyxa salina]